MQQHTTPPRTTRARTIEMSPESQHSVPVYSKQQQAVKPNSQVSPQPSIDDILIEGEARTISKSEEHNGVPRFQPFQNLLKTPIKLKYGNKLQGEYTIHLELVGCYSTTIRGLFNEAVELTRDYKNGASIRKNIKALLPPETPHDSFQVEKAIELIGQCLKKYPLPEHQTTLRTLLEHMTDHVFQNKDLWKGPVPNAAHIKKKSSEYPRSDVKIRLQCLTPDAVRHVTDALYRKLVEIKKFETLSTRRDFRKAAAQGIIFLPQFEGDAIGGLVGWIYQQDKFHFDTAKNLCNLYTLADELGVKDLAATCLNKLASAAYDGVYQARKNGTGIRAILEEAQSSEATAESPNLEPMSDIVPSVFNYVQKALNPPQVLESLVVNAIADSKDEQLLEFLKPSLDLKMALKLCEAFMVRSCKGDTSESGTKMEMQTDEKA